MIDVSMTIARHLSERHPEKQGLKPDTRYASDIDPNFQSAIQKNKD